MSIEIAELIVRISGIYLAIGAAFGLLFILFGARRIDPSAKSMPVQARLIILPGVIGLWPLMVIKLFSQREPPLS